MSFQNFRRDNYCVRRRHESARTKIVRGISSEGENVLYGHCSICDRKISMTVSDKTIQAECPDDFYKNLGKKGLSVSKKMPKYCFRKSRKSFGNRSKRWYYLCISKP